jgi:hypothetical protein
MTDDRYDRRKWDLGGKDGTDPKLRPREIGITPIVQRGRRGEDSASSDERRSDRLPCACFKPANRKPRKSDRYRRRTNTHRGESAEHPSGRAAIEHERERLHSAQPVKMGGRGRRVGLFFPLLLSGAARRFASFRSISAIAVAFPRSLASARFLSRLRFFAINALASRGVSGNAPSSQLWLPPKYTPARLNISTFFHCTASALRGARKYLPIGTRARPHSGQLGT